ncbi:DUF2213 domain-containing protein [Pseudomonas chlororaphis]|uniref:DUF2213 domain-containing protein n=1 Tax=Pseudomonas chlororaphis TaxID=587753 RepID=UPI0015DEDB55|nr:DUF2213 domain-containing protein [Pseudomonas chlororaphis]QLL11711.1 DUF2213 domain-containing protein [Pseudomonas chlororaphis subsp. aurantiaca]
MKVRTQDEAGRWFAPERLSARQSMTPEGFLLCEAVPIARTGTLVYDESELVNEDGPLIQGGGGGLVTIERNPDQVFRAETIASFEGKPVTMAHPDDFVTPANWRELSMGITQNVRQGDGVESDLMLADLLITDATAIEEVRSGLRQVSCGYDAEYEQLAVGRGRQTNIVGNHVALVERGRCGPRCAIGDSEVAKTTDAKPQKRTWMDRVRTAFRAKDEAALEEALEESKTEDEDMKEEGKENAKTGDSATLDSILKAVTALGARVGDMEAEVKKITEDEDPDDDKSKTEDDVLEAEEAARNPEASGKTYTGDAEIMTDLRSRAEILVPGISFQTRDAKTKTADHVCSCQRQALTKAMQTGDGKALVEPFLTGRDLSKMTADQVSAAFIGVTEFAKMQNNASGARNSITTKDFGRPPLSVAEINQRNREFWNGSGRN